MLEPLWKVLREEEGEIDLQEAILKAKLPPYEARMAVRGLLEIFTKRWSKLPKVFGRDKEAKALAKSEEFGYVILLEKCENSDITPEGLDLHLWFEKLRYNKTVSVENPLFDVNAPIQVIKPITYSLLLESRMENHGKLPQA
jgi:hypothetical protein